MKRRGLSEILIVLFVAACAIGALDRLRQGSAPFNHIGLIGIPLFFVYAPIALARFAGRPGSDFGFTLEDLGSALRKALVAAAVILPVFIGMYGLYWWGIKGQTPTFHLSQNLVSVLSWNLIGVAFAEEVFFRGYLQTRLSELFPKRIRLLGTDLGVAVILASVLFALAHLVTHPSAARLAVFFPSLVFGWLRERTKSIAGPTLLHWLANSTLFFLEGSL